MGGVGVIRVSGSKAFEIVQKMFSKEIKEAGKIHHGWILDGVTRIDEVILLPFKNPNSFTGEDVIEIQCHGGPKVVKKILELTKGSIIELENKTAEPIDLLVNGKPIGKGEVVIIEDNFGLRITDTVDEGLKIHE